jgi:hypothetical protein
MKQYPFLPLCLMVLIVLLIAGCTQSSPGSQHQNVPQTLKNDTPPPTVTGYLPRGTPDSDFYVDVSVPEKIWPGTTILPDNHNSTFPKIIEVNRLGEIVWEYPLPEELKSFTNPGWDVENLPNGNILTVLPRKGVYEINRNKQVVWKYLDPRVSHDADRLENGNTLIAFGAGDTAGDAQVKEIDPAGNIIWSWHAKDVFTGAEYSGIADQGWTHTNAVTRLESGNTLISLRNFNVIAEVDPRGKLVRTIGKGLLKSQHDPLVLPNGNILLANQDRPQTAVELDPSGNIVWQFTIRDRRSWPVRDANQLPNGNTLITEADRIVEVTKDGQVVWQFRLAANTFTKPGDPVNGPESRGFYKAERISA